MSVERYRDARDMPPPPRPAAGELLRQIAAAWERAHICRRPDFIRGVTRFRSLAEAQAARRRSDQDQARRLRRARMGDPGGGEKL